MAQTGYTPIQLYYSSTTSNTPLAASLAGGELAINITDGKLFYKDNANAIQVIGWKIVPATAGGTGQTSYAIGDILYASTTTALSKLADVATGNALISGGVGVAPSYGKIGLTTHVSGTLPTANGGTNLTSFTSNGVLYASSTSALTTSSGLLFNGTNAAINTPISSYILDVGGSVNSSTSINVNNTGTTTNILFASSGQTGTTARSNVIARLQSTASGRDACLQFSDNVANAAEIGMVNGPMYFATAGAQRMSISTGGIVTMSAYGVGTATFSAAGVISSVSDETWKIKDGVPSDPDSMLKKLTPGYWYYNDEKKEVFGVDRQLGFYAQNVNAAIGPEAAPEPSSYTTTDLDGNEITTKRSWGYYDRSVLAVVVLSLQKALTTIDSLNARIEALEAKS